jgi:hypothetical protein
VQIDAVRRGAALSFVDDDLRRCGRVVSHQVRLRAAHDGDVALFDVFLGAVVIAHPGVAVHHRHHRQR